MIINNNVIIILLYFNVCHVEAIKTMLKRNAKDYLFKWKNGINKTNFPFISQIIQIIFLFKSNKVHIKIIDFQA